MSENIITILTLLGIVLISGLSAAALIYLFNPKNK